MSLSKGSLTYARFFVEGDRPDVDACLAAIRLRAFRPLKATDELDESVGWCSVHHHIDLDLTHEKAFDGDFITLGLRTDRWKIPGAIMAAHMREAETAMLAELGKDRLSRTQKEDLRAMVERKLRERSMPAMRVYDLAWDTDAGVVRFFATSPKVHDVLHELFEKTFGCRLIPEGVYTRAERLGLTASELDALCTILPFVIHREDDDQ